MAPHDSAERENSSAMLCEPLLPTNDQDCRTPLTTSVRENDLPSDDIAVPSSPPPQLSSTRNVTIILWYTWSIFAGRSIWNQNVLANFAFLLRDGDPKAVGFLTAAMGISQLIISFPAGFLADKYRRDTILKLSSVIGVVAILATLVALHRESFFWLLVSLSVWGLYWGCAQTSVTALFADSIPDGQRAHYFTTRSILIKFGQLAGPVVALIMFVILGDKWTIHDCSIVMMVGQLFCLPAIFLLCLLNDDATAHPHEATTLQEPLLENHEDSTSIRSDEESAGEESSPTSPAQDDDEGELSERQQAAAASVHCDETYDEVRLGLLFPFISSTRIIPTLVATADVTSGLASGMSIRYFAIFLVDNLNIGPSLVQVLYIIAPIVQMGLMKLIMMFAKRGGRCLLAVAFKWIGIALMLTMVVSYTRGWPSWVTCTILIWRTAFMNSPSALTRSVLMDHVKKEERAKWSALESLNMFSWSGSAVIGGFLVDKEGIIFNFCVTACLQFIATLPLVVLSCYRKQGHRHRVS
jgi:MFS family permease